MTISNRLRVQLEALLCRSTYLVLRHSAPVPAPRNAMDGATEQQIRQNRKDDRDD
jgi:hypothetical protein